MPDANEAKDMLDGLNDTHDLGIVMGLHLTSNSCVAVTACCVSEQHGTAQHGLTGQIYMPGQRHGWGQTK